ncbi:hypothetical protein HX882_00835 [Pseudomonas gingeri]|uniref:Short-chain dehydrogenase n=2 Tax=Pseudomonas gingeri TaxID=117681 RepID=A0A7Y7X6Y8_9PSED|nr:hypothetical protein [Pseudomonas gingeri]
MTMYHPLTTNPIGTPVLLIDTQAPLRLLHETACARIRAGTAQLETLTSVTIRNIDDADLYRLTNGAYLLLQDGLDILDRIQFRLPPETPQQG